MVFLVFYCCHMSDLDVVSWLLDSFAWKVKIKGEIQR